MSSLDETLRAADVSPAQIDRVLCTGGTARVPWLRQALIERFGASKLHDLDPFLRRCPWFDGTGIRNRPGLHVNKYALYEQAVQSPKRHIEWFVSVYRDLNGKYARHLREDFCGTFRLCCEWVRRNKRNTAVGLDLDATPLAYGKRTHYRALSGEQKTRMRWLKKDVRTVTTPKADVIIACNFSFCVFKQRKVLLEYLKCCLRSLRPDGIVILEIAGGPGMIEETRERKRIYRNGKVKYTYVWDQKSFNPIDQGARYAIHFKFPDGRELKDAFTYDWRIWRPSPSSGGMLVDAGFKKTYASTGRPSTKAKVPGAR